MTRSLLPFRTLIALAAALSLVIATACGESSVTDPYQEAAGVFLLHSINGDELPALFISSPTEGTVEVTTGSLFLSADRRFQETLTIRLTPPGQTTPQSGAAVARGTYTIVGDSVQFALEEPGATHPDTVQAKLRGDTLSYDVFGRIVLYLKI